MSTIINLCGWDVNHVLGMSIMSFYLQWINITIHNSDALRQDLCLGETVGKSCQINRFLNQSFDGNHIKHKNMEEIYHTEMVKTNQTFNIQITDTTNNHIVSHNNEMKEIAQNKNTDMLHIKLKGIDNYAMKEITVISLWFRWFVCHFSDIHNKSQTNHGDLWVIFLLFVWKHKFWKQNVNWSH